MSRDLFKGHLNSIKVYLWKRGMGLEAVTIILFFQQSSAHHLVLPAAKRRNIAVVRVSGGNMCACELFRL